LPQLANFRRSFAHAGQAMDRGFHVLVFPEGRRTPDGVMHPFQKGSGMLWKELQCDALPVFLNIEKPSVHVGKPIAFDRDADATKVLEDAVRSLEADTH
jgi:1-acyl-sn-glycerol-3-phosphate acyltransferase